MSLLPWSYSKLATYEKCPAQAKFRYIDHLPTPKNDKAQRGIEVHNSIENFLKAGAKRAPLHPEVHENYRPMLKELRLKRVEAELKVAVNERWQIVDFRSPDAWGRSVLDTCVWDEKTLTVKSFEWKTGKIYDDHKDQRAAYILFMNSLYPEATTLIVETHYLDLQKKKRAKKTPEQLPLMRDSVNMRVWHMANDGDYIPRPGYYCGWCPYSRYKDGPCKKG